LLIAFLVSALLVGGMLPSAHLHHSTSTRPQIVHSHLPTQPAHSSARAARLSASDHSDRDAVSLDARVVSRVPAPPAFGSGLVPQGARVSPPASSLVTLAAFEPRAPESPPLQFAASRAPPAC